MDPLDGNAIAGPLQELFGAEMTTETGVCRHCGAEGQLAELRVYNRAPGSVARCQHCGSVVFVIVEVAGQLQIDLDCYELPSGLQPLG